MKRQVMHTLAAACLVAAAGPVLAEASSSAVFSHLVVTLTDLDPNDGIAPSLAFNFMGASFVASETEGSGDRYESPSFYTYAKQQQGLLEGTTTTAWSTATGAIQTAPTLAGFTAMSATGIAYSGLDGWGKYHSLATGSVPQNEFVLSANTRLTISVETDMRARTTMGYNLDADMGEYASSHVLLNVLGMINGEYRAAVEERYIDAGFEVLDDNTTVGVSSGWHGLLSVSFDNDTALASTGIFQTFVQTEGWSAVWDGVTPVPEPGTYAMMLGGLAVLGAMGRRRRGQTPRP